jgi:peroxiredoxin
MVRATPRAPALVLAFLAALAGCAGPAGPVHLPDAAFAGSDGATHRLGTIAAGARYTVIVFFAAGCPVQRAHDAQLLSIHAAYRPRGVAVIAVDSEAEASVEDDRAEARARRYPFLILSDPEGRAADALGATYAAYAVVVDAGGRVRYRGGIDSAKSHPSPDASPWLRDALDRLLEGREPDPIETTSLGCALRRR